MSSEWWRVVKYFRTYWAYWIGAAMLAAGIALNYCVTP